MVLNLVMYVWQVDWIGQKNQIDAGKLRADSAL
jgi:hypothetical protein